MKLHDAVKLKVDLPDENLKRGMVGAIVEIFDKPQLAYEIEFTDSEGRTIAEITLLPDQVEIA